MEARPGSVADLFEAVVAFMIAPVDEDRAVTHPVAVSGIGQIGGGRHLGDAGPGPVIVALDPVGAEARGVRCDAVAVSVLALAELDVNTRMLRTKSKASPEMSTSARSSDWTRTRGRGSRGTLS